MATNKLSGLQQIVGVSCGRYLWLLSQSTSYPTGKHQHYTYSYIQPEQWSQRVDIPVAARALVVIYTGWLALRWPLVKHLDGLWLIFLNQYPFAWEHKTSNQ